MGQALFPVALRQESIPIGVSQQMLAKTVYSLYCLDMLVKAL
jgi:hypothetical protein